MKQDVIIIGSGMSGSASAWYLAQKGYSVLVIEGGEDIASTQLPLSSVDWELKKEKQFSPVASGRKNVGDYPVNDKNSPISVCNFNAVGGSSLLYSAHFPRFLSSDFRLKELEGVAKNWPINYRDLLPFFDLNEEMVVLAGKVGDPYYPEIKKVFNSPVPLGVAGETLAMGFEQLNLHWWPSYAAINIAQNISGRSKCHGLGPCNAGCPIGAKATANNTYLAKAPKDRLTLLSKTSASKILFKKNEVVGVETINSSGQVSKIFCSNVILAAGAIGTPRLLLNSLRHYDVKKFVTGYHLVGKNLMMHPLGYAQGYFPDKDIHAERGPQGAMLYSLEYYRPKEKLDFELGFMMHALRGDAPVDCVKRLYKSRQLRFGKEIYSQFKKFFGHTLGIAVVCEDLPDVNNKVELDETEDALGQPGVKVSYTISDNSKRMMSYGLKRAREVLITAGARKTSGFGPIRNTGWHLSGTACMGANPNTSVVDPYGGVHGMKGLHVVDASVFVTSSCVNPANTIQALSLYLTSKIDERIKNAG